MIHGRLSRAKTRLLVFALTLVGTALIATAPTPAGLSLQGQYAFATMFFAGVLWVTGVLPLALAGGAIFMALRAIVSSGTSSTYGGRR